MPKIRFYHQTNENGVLETYECDFCNMVFLDLKEAIEHEKNCRKEFWQKINKAVEEQIVDPVKTGIETCTVKVDSKIVEISFNHSTGEIILKRRNNG